MKIRVSNANRIVSSILTVGGSILFFAAFTLLGYFIYDEDIINYNLPRISHNPYFDLCGHVACIKSIYSKVFMKILFNSSLISLFWFQHLLMANNRFKIYLTNFTNYPTYERGLFVFITDIILLAFIFLWQPIPEIHFFSLRGTFIDHAFKSLAFMALIEFTMTLPFMLQTDLFGINRLYDIITKDEITFPIQIKISTPFIYRGCRHPMQSAFIGMFFFSSSLYNLGRLLFVLLFVEGIIIGVNQEESYLNNSSGYIEYKGIVRNKFIPNIFNYFNDNIIRRLKTDKQNDSISMN